MAKAISRLLKFDVFKTMSRYKLNELCTYYFKEFNLHKGTFLYREGESPTDGVYFVINGQLELFKEDPFEVDQDVRKKKKNGDLPEKKSSENLEPSSEPTPKESPLRQGSSNPERRHPMRSVIPALGVKQHGVSLTIVTDNEVVGIEEVIMKKKIREQSVKVISDTAFILFMKQQDFKDRVLYPYPSIRASETLKIQER